VTVQQNSIYSD